MFAVSSLVSQALGCMIFFSEYLDNHITRMCNLVSCVPAQSKFRFVWNISALTLTTENKQCMNDICILGHFVHLPAETFLSVRLAVICTCNELMFLRIVLWLNLNVGSSSRHFAATCLGLSSVIFFTLSLERLKTVKKIADMATKRVIYLSPNFLRLKNEIVNFNLSPYGRTNETIIFRALT